MVIGDLVEVVQVRCTHSSVSAPFFGLFYQMVRVAWLFWFSKIIELMDTVSQTLMPLIHSFIHFGHQGPPIAIKP